MANWQKIKTEYITTDTSYRKLADKYGLDQATIARRAKKEGWVSNRQQNASKTQAKIVNAISNKQVDRAAKLISVADLLLDKVKSLVEESPELLLSTQSIKNLSGVLKDIKEVQMVRSEADMREQEARIAKLRREAEREEDTNTEVVITFGSGGKKEWAE
jgi:tRNA-dihydrouridine synthase